ncbi:hypothetical protein [Streptomyces carminius]|uniref:hypothetical protein n=1 Tax=Streptomyces carminius TaxID=2665496 RepID=UPI00130471EA|nr:hypothetical protein [Streptomyces carminius]
MQELSYTLLAFSLIAIAVGAGVMLSSAEGSVRRERAIWAILAAAPLVAISIVLMLGT